MRQSKIWTYTTQEFKMEVAPFKFDGGKGRFTIFVEALQGSFKPANILGVNFVIAKLNTGLCSQKCVAYKQALLGGCLTICWCCASCRSSWRCTWFAPTIN